MVETDHFSTALHPLLRSRLQYICTLKLSLGDNSLRSIYLLQDTSYVLHLCFGMTEVNKGLWGFKSPHPALNPLKIVALATVFCLRAAVFYQHKSSTRQGPGASLMSVPVVIASPAYRGGCRAHTTQPTSCAESKAGLLCVKENRGATDVR